jgi:DNA-binding FrmR family transcriptional regulator
LSQGNPDIRQQVDANRGAVKKLQLLIPGLRGYRSKEDIRVSDELLRNQVADRLDRIKGNLEQLRKQMAEGNDLTNLTSMGSLISQVQTLSGEIRHAAQGYAGWVAPIQINEGKLNKLYDYDYSFVSSVFQLDEATAPGKLTYDRATPNSIQSSVSGFASAVSDIRQKWSQRVEAIEGIALGQC